MIKFLINIVEIAILAKILYGTAKIFFGKQSFGRKRKGKSIAGKIAYLLSNRIHATLDGMIKAQKRPAVKQAPSNVVPFKRYKRVN